MPGTNSHLFLVVFCTRYEVRLPSWVSLLLQTNTKTIYLSAYSWSGTKGIYTNAIVCFPLSFFKSKFFLPIAFAKIIPFMEGDQQTGPCEPSGALTIFVSRWVTSWATLCCCWSRVCFVCCRYCGPHCCSLRRAGTSGPAVCQLSHLRIEQERERGGISITERQR